MISPLAGLVLCLLRVGASGDLGVQTAISTVEADNGRRWHVAFDLETLTDLVVVTVRINLIAVGNVTSVRLEQRKTEWERAIEELWSRRFAVVAGTGQPVPIRVDVSFQGPGFHQRVLVRDSSPANDQLHWSIRATGQSIAHEFGHMIGAFDEYRGGGTDPAGAQLADEGSIMRSLPRDGRTRARHYHLILEELKRRWNRTDLSLVELPEPTSAAH